MKLKVEDYETVKMFCLYVPLEFVVIFEISKVKVRSKFLNKIKKLLSRVNSGIMSRLFNQCNLSVLKNYPFPRNGLKQNWLVWARHCLGSRSAGDQDGTMIGVVWTKSGIRSTHQLGDHDDVDLVSFFVDFNFSQCLLSVWLWAPLICSHDVHGKI